MQRYSTIDVAGVFAVVFTGLSVILAVALYLAV
jgi:hypothetical protein